MSQSNNTSNRMTALGLLEQMRRAGANREAEFNPITATLRERRGAPTAPLFGGQRQQALPTPPRPPAVVPPQQAQALPIPPRPPVNPPQQGQALPPAILPQAPGAEPIPLHERFNPENPHVATAIQMAERYGLPRNVFLSVINRESAFRPNAVSDAGAIGFGQLMPGTARELGVDPTDPAQNLEGSARYLRQMLDRHKGDMPLALASYNAGPGRVARAGNVIPNNPETQAYVPGVLRDAGVPGYAMGGLAELEHKYEGGGLVGMMTGLARRATRRTPALRPDEVPMVAMHNAREIGLEKIANNEGVIVAPSIGISRADDPMDSFGEISLMASPQTINPSKTPVYGRDAYTPRYPSVIPMTVRGQEKDYVRLYNENTGQTRLLPHTPKNALRVMTNDPWRGGEDFITDNWLLGQMTPQFRNMSELRGARDRLVLPTDRSLDDWRQGFRDLRSEWEAAGATSPYWQWAPEFERNLAEAARRGPGGMQYVNSTYYNNAFPEDLLARTEAHLNAGRDLPTTYFEAKPRRIVPLNEFQGAVVPQQASKDVTDLLRRYGVDDIQYYNRGDNADRAAQIRRFERLMFGAAPVAAGAAVEAAANAPEPEGYAEGGLADLHQKYADGGDVMSDEEYDRRLLGRMQRDMGRTDVPSWDEQRATLVDAAGRAARGVFDVVVPQTPLDVGLTLATGPVGSMVRRGAIAGAGYLLDPDEAQANVIRRVGRALGRAGAGAADTALEAAATPTAPTRRRGTIGIIPEETAPAARVTQDVEGYRPNIDPVTGRAILPAAEDLLAAPRSDFPYLDVPQPSNARQNQALLAEQQNMTPGTGNTYSGNMDPLVNERVTFRGREPREWSPSDWGAYGRQYGTDRLGPVDDAAWQSSLREYDAGGGQRISIPGGLETDAPFTYYDQLFLKSQGIDPSQMPKSMHVALQRRILNSVTPDADDPVAAYNGLMMGFASPNNPLFPNQIAMTRLRARSPEDIERLADMLPWQAGDDVSKADRAAFNRRIAEVYGLDAGPQAAVTAREAIPRVPGRRAREAVLDENGRVIRPAQSARAAREAKPAREAEEATIGGTGARGSPDYTRIAEFAQMYRDRPDFFRFNPDPNLSNSENWSRFVERIVSQVPGLSAKTGSFGAVWQQPATAAISAIDRHMANQIGSRIFPDRQALDKFNERVITKWNSGLTPAQRKTDRVSDIEELTNNDRGNTFLQSELLNAVGQHSGMRVRNPRGGLNPDLPSHLTPEEANWVREPRNVATLGSHYREALSENARMAEQEGLGLFGSQWLNWDRIRRRLEPHENMNPVLSRIPPMALEQLQDARLTHRAMGSTNYTKVRPTPEQEAAALRAGDNVNASPRLLPTSRVANPSGLGYFAAPPLVAGSLAGEGEAAPSLEELDQRYAEGGRVRRLLGAVGRAVTREAPEQAAPTIRGLSDVRPTTDNIQTVIDSNFDAGRLVGDRMMPIDKVYGGAVAGADSQRRVQELANRINGPEGYFSRIIVDQDGNVVEGAHRLDALRLLGASEVPVTQIEDIFARIDTPRLKDAIRASGLRRSDDVNAVSAEAVNLLGRYGTPEAVLNEMEFAPGFENYYRAALDEAHRQMTPSTARSLEELDQRYAEGGPVMSDEEYDRRLLSRMKAQTGRTTESTNAEQAQALRNAGYDAAQLASDIFLPQSPLDAALMVALGPGPRMARLVGSAALAAMEPSEAEAIISPRTARSIRMATRLPQDVRFRQAVEATPGASITDDGLSLEVLRYQKPEQAGAQAIREGVFYLPATLPSRSVGSYKGTNTSSYGGPEMVRGETLLRAPLAVPGNTGGRVPERAFRELTSDANMQRLERDSLRAANSGLPRPEYYQNIENFLNEWGGNPDIATDLVNNSRAGNRMRFALQENVIGNRARQEGYDSIVGTGARTPRITEVFDLREAAYPVPGSPEFEMLLPRFEESLYAQGGLAQLEHKYAEGGAVSAQPAIYDPDAINALANQIEADYV